MIIRELNSTEFSEIYSTHMIYDFPAAELKPLERILFTMSTGLCHTFGLYEDNDLKGYAIFIVPADSDYALLDYLAILKDKRGNGYGHKFFNIITDYFSKYFPELKGFFIECESIESSKNENERLIREKRISFYRNNGCHPTSLMSNLFDVEYIILHFSCKIPISDTTDLTEHPLVFDNIEAVDIIYRAMFKKHHYENRVQLWCTKS